MSVETLSFDFCFPDQKAAKTDLLKKAKFFGWTYGQWCGAMWYLRQLPEDVPQAMDMLRWFRQNSIEPEPDCLPEAEAYAGKAAINLMKTAERSLRMATDGTKSLLDLSGPGMGRTKLLGDDPPAFDLHRFRYGTPIDKAALAVRFPRWPL